MKKSYYEFNYDKFMRLFQKSGMTQAELAGKADLSDVSISYICTKRTKPSRITILKLADAFGIDYEELLL